MINSKIIHFTSRPHPHPQSCYFWDLKFILIMHFFGCKIKYLYRLKGCQTTAQVSQARRIVLAGGNIPTKTSCSEGGEGEKFCFYLFPSFTVATFPSIYASKQTIFFLLEALPNLKSCVPNQIDSIPSAECIFRLCIFERHHFAEMGSLADFSESKMGILFLRFIASFVS